ncbi:N-6 DNA methylase [Ruminococcus sp.]|uniref:Eco57I restriction-modification methylase domain-containing protein n=1 Tax=Ruminococcus sp. TaxID=41978 RepID=UPI0025D014A5|nr:N-6 DNA methylase [Ruminococcus sp.]MBQ6252226.1 N-6 DNA methylase [Ruminococcus sp.]
MDISLLKKFAMNARSELMAGSDEKTAYFGFMRLCAAYMAEPSFAAELLSTAEELRSALFKEKCRQLGSRFGGIFSLSPELPVPPQLLADGGTAAKLLCLGGEYFGSDMVLGQLHQYFNEPYRQEIAVGLKNSKRLSSDKVAAATQIFTPEWVVRYMVQNTLVRYIRRYGHDIAEGELSFGCPLGTKRIAPEEIKLIDPCMGSGNVLLYAFDVFMELYRSCGCTDKEAAEKILTHNLFGLELEPRACSLAETALCMKAARYGADTAPQVYDFSGVNETVGSLINSDELSEQDSKSAIIGQLLQQKYDIIVTNPPYLGKPAMNTELRDYICGNYGDYCADLFSAFMAKSVEMLKNGGYMGFLTPATWLFLQSYEKLRRLILTECPISTLIHFEYSAFDDATVPLCAFTAVRDSSQSVGIYVRLADVRGDMEQQRRSVIAAAGDEDCSCRFRADASKLAALPTAPIAYWLGEPVLRAFYGTALGEVVPVREGLITGDNDRFLRRWFEVEADKIAFSGSRKCKWYLLNKGGSYRRWYGNREYVVNWENEGEEIMDFRDEKGKLRSRPQGLSYNFRPSVSWSQITSGAISVRYFDENFMFNVAGTSAFPEDGESLIFLLGLLNSKPVQVLSEVLNPTMNMNPGDIARLPLPGKMGYTAEISSLVRENAELCREDWDSFETSWDFGRHPLV